MPNPSRFPRSGLVAWAFLLLLSAAVLSAAAWLRGTEYDENYTVFVTAGTPRPDWPLTPFRAGDERAFFHGMASPARIAEELRHTDVHPPLYFWAVADWREAIGSSLFLTRLFSVLCSLAALAIVAGLAAQTSVPAIPAVLLTLGCYGFSYTGAIARGFALAQLLSLLGVLLILLAERRRSIVVALGAGLMLGLATFTNYLAAFVGAAALLWLLLRQPRRTALWLAAGVGFAVLLPPDLWFFLAQRSSRVAQFPPFRLLPSLVRLGQYSAANVFGGLPLYVTGLARVALGGALAALLVALVAVIAWRFSRIGRPGARWLLAMAAAAPPVGLIALGLVFDNTPIELRYLAFATPFLALLAAGALASLGRGGRLALAGMLAIQAVSLTGMVVMPQTMQPQRAATAEAASLAGPDGLVVVPHGDDGVGIVAATIAEAPDGMELLQIPRGTDPATIRARVGSARRVVLVLLGLDRDSRATLPAMQEAFAGQPCWREAGHTEHTVAFDRICGPEAEAASPTEGH